MAIKTFGIAVGVITFAAALIARVHWNDEVIIRSIDEFDLAAVKLNVNNFEIF